MGKRKLKPQVKIALIIIGVIFGFIILENLVGVIGDLIKTWKAQAAYNKQQELYEQTPEYEEEQYVIKSIEKAMEYIENENYLELYNRLDAEYKDAFSIDSIEKFEKIMKDHLGNSPQNATLYDYTELSGKYICDILVKLNDYDSELRKISIIPSGDEDFSVILDEVIQITNYENESLGASVDYDYSYKLLYKIRTDSKDILIFNVTNNMNTTVKGSYADSKLEKSNYEKLTPSNIDELRNVELKAKTSTRVTFSFTRGESSKYLDDTMRFVFKRTDGTVDTRNFDMVGAYN